MKPVKINRFNMFNLKFFKKLNKTNRIHPSNDQNNLTSNHSDISKNNSYGARLPSNYDYNTSGKISDDSL